MRKLYYLGELRSRDDEKDQVYIDIITNVFVCQKIDGTKRNLTLNQKRYLRERFEKEIRKADIKYEVNFFKKPFLIGALTTLILLTSLKYKNILTDIPRITKEYCFEDEKDIDLLVHDCGMYIDKNKTFSDEQKEYLKRSWEKYIKDEGINFDFLTIIRMLNNLSDVKFEYTEDDTVVANHKDFPHKITLNKNYGKNFNLFHETVHCSIGLGLDHDFLDLEEGYCGGATGKYCYHLTYATENEYLLIIREIIGKDNLVHCIANGKEKELVKLIANATNKSEAEIKDLINKTNKSLLLCKEQEEISILEKEIKKQLALLAIEADEKNKENFIILNALQGKYILDSSFLEDKIWYKSSDFYTYLGINNETKYSKAYLFDEIEEYRLIKKQTNE